MRFLFLGTFVLALVLQSVWWGTEGIYDAEIWGLQPQYMATGNAEQFDASKAYGHPGGPLIIATFVVQRVADVDSTVSLLIALTVLNSVAIASISMLAYVLWHRKAWAILLAIFFSLHPLYLAATPPSALAALLAVILTFLTYWLLTHGVALKQLLMWGTVAGVLMATRADVGFVFTTFLGFALLSRAGIRAMVYSALAALATFFVLDPFMWTIPFTHLYDLAFKGYYHFALITPSALSPSTVLSISLFALVAVILATVSFVRRDNFIPVPLYISLTLLTIFLYSILLSAVFQTERYFMPIIFVWEAFLPLVLFSYVDRLPRARSRVLFVSAYAVLFAYPLTHFITRML